MEVIDELLFTNITALLIAELVMVLVMDVPPAAVIVAAVPEVDAPTIVEVIEVPAALVIVAAAVALVYCFW